VRGVDPGQHVDDGEVDVVHAAEGGVVHRVERDGDAVQAGIFEHARLAGQQRAVGRERDIERPATDSGQGAQHGDQLFQVFAQQRLAAGQADFFDAVRDEQARHARDFFERQQRRMGQVRVILVEHFLRHAIHTTEIAAVGNGNAQVVQRAREGVGQQAIRRGQDRGNGRDARARIAEHDDFFGHADTIARGKRPRSMEPCSAAGCDRHAAG